MERQTAEAGRLACFLCCIHLGLQDTNAMRGNASILSRWCAKFDASPTLTRLHEVRVPALSVSLECQLTLRDQALLAIR
jgi:hypothetical protein